MPRDGAHIYNLPFPDVSPSTTIESTVYNGFTHDVAQDLNAPRPIVAGGTGATDADTALANLNAEKEGQVVTNFDSMVWLSGSFYAASTATSPPVAGHAFAGIVYVTDVNNIVVEARDTADGKLYIRRKTAGTWGAWAVDTAATDAAIAAKVDRAGDTMTGPLVLPAAAPTTGTQATNKTYVDAGDDSMLKYSAQTLTAAQQTQARQNIYAAPFDAMAYNGMQLNGGADFSQERGTTTFTPTANLMTHAQDGWHCFFGTAPLVMSVAPANNATPSVALGFPAALTFQSTTGKTPLASNDQIFLENTVEGYRTARLNWGTANAQPVSIGFWVLSQIMTGTMTVAIINAAANRTYIANVPINTLNTFEYKTLTVPGDTAGTWDKTNNAGMFIRFCFGAGSSLTGGVPGWQAGAFSASASTTNFHAAPNIVGITGLVVLPGIELPPAARSPLIARPYDQELLLCKRYWQRITCGLRYYAPVNGTFGEYHVMFPVAMRATPTVTMLTATLTNNVGGSAPSLGNQDALSGRYIMQSSVTGDTYVVVQPVILDARL